MSVDLRTRADMRAAPHQPAASGYLAALRHRWPLLLVTVAISATSAFAISDLVLPKVYQSSSTVIINTQPHSNPRPGAAAVDPFLDDQSLSETFEQLALQPAVVDDVARRMGIRPTKLAKRINVHAIPRTPLVVISFDAPTPTDALRGAQIYTATFVQSAQRTAFLPGRALVVSAATRPTEPIAPRTILNTSIAGLAGLVAALVVLLGRVQSQVQRDPMPVDVDPRAIRPLSTSRADRGPVKSAARAKRSDPGSLDEGLEELRSGG